ncbi:prolipoprotein diacylglyceryl transferase family protein [Planctomycetota bacterium]
MRKIPLLMLLGLAIWLFAGNPENSQAAEERLGSVNDGPEESMQEWHDTAPKVVTIIPADGSQDVDPNLKAIEVTFDRPMRDKSWSVVVLGSPGQFPLSNGTASYGTACRVFRMPVILEPEKEYAFGLNSEQHRTFMSQEGIPLVPVEVRFKTRAGVPLPPGETTVKFPKSKMRQIKAYGWLYLLGFILHFVVAWRMAKKLKLRRRVAIAVSLCYVVGMIAGAKFLHHWHHIGFDPWVIFRYQEYVRGGLWGGMLAYLVLVVPVVVLFTQRKRAGLDLAALALPVPWALGKIGCLCNGCCNGQPTSLPWAITFSEGSASTHVGVPVHPSQIYEVVLMIFLMVLLCKLNQKRWRGTLLFWFVSLYGIGRAVIDLSRGDAEHHTYLGPITLTQLICLVAAAVSLVFLLFVKPKRESDSQRLAL